MRDILRKCIAGIDRLARGLRFAGQIALAGMVVSICYDTVMRYLFASPTLWSLDASTFLVVFITILPAGDILKADMHLRITFFSQRFHHGVKKAIDGLIAAVGILFCGFMTWNGWTMAMQALKYNVRMSTSLGTPWSFHIFSFRWALGCFAFNTG
jgi:TRAP-type C4-dicarboxylate transport system permease small subunit